MAIKSVLMLVLVAGTFCSAQPEMEASKQCMTVANVAASNKDLSTLLELAETAGLTSLISDPEAVITLLTPTNQAWAEYIAAQSDPESAAFADDPAAIVDAQKLHTIAGAIKSTDLSDGMMLEVLSGGELRVLLGDSVQFQAENSVATVITPDLEACKAVVHIIDTVLF